MHKVRESKTFNLPLLFGSVKRKGERKKYINVSPSHQRKDTEKEKLK